MSEIAEWLISPGEYESHVVCWSDMADERTPEPRMEDSETAGEMTFADSKTLAVWHQGSSWVQSSGHIGVHNDINSSDPT